MGCRGAASATQEVVEEVLRGAGATRTAAGARRGAGATAENPTAATAATGVPRSAAGRKAEDVLEVVERVLSLRQDSGRQVRDRTLTAARRGSPARGRAAARGRGARRRAAAGARGPGGGRPRRRL